MEPAEIIAQIRPCDMDQSYIFISYSAQDYVRVWEDVYTFQQLGYNVWLDEKNLDKTKASWTEDALAAISDLDCLLVVFYVSQYSLTSENCFRELCQTTAKDTTELHFGPVPFIAVDAENVGNIGAYTKAIHKQVLAQPISKQEKGQKARKGKAKKAGKAPARSSAKPPAARVPRKPQAPSEASEAQPPSGGAQARPSAEPKRPEPPRDTGAPRRRRSDRR